MSAPSRPNTVSRFLRAPGLAALTGASAASSAVLNDCWAFATDASANASTAAINAASLARDGAGLVDERMVIMASSVAFRSGTRSSRCRTSTFLRALQSRPTPDATPVSRQSVPDPGDGRDPGARCDPPLVRLQLQAELVIEDHEVAVATLHDRVRHDRLHLLRHDADIGLLAAVIAETIEPKAVVETAEKGDVVLEHNIGAPAAASSATSGHARRSSATADALAAAIGLDASLGA